jgi:hypothetical protein
MPDDRSGAPRRPRIRGTNGSHLSETPTVRTRFDDVSETPTVRTRFDVPEDPTVRMRFDDASDEPVDLMAVQADDELIDALASGMAVSAPGRSGYDVDDHVVALLAAWKAEVDADPVPPLVDVDAAAARVRAAARPAGRRLRLVAPLAAAAVLILSVGGIGYNAGVNAGPDDGLAWEIARVVDGDRVESVLAAERVEERIAEAKAALTRGEPEVAARALAAAAQDLQVVRAEENASDLAAVQSFLEAKVAETPPGTPTQPDAPLLSDPTRPVPPGASPSVPAAAPAPGPAPVPGPVPAVPAPAPGTGAGPGTGITRPELATSAIVPPDPGPSSGPPPAAPVPSSTAVAPAPPVDNPPPPVPSSDPTPPSSVAPTSNPEPSTPAAGDGGSATPAASGQASGTSRAVEGAPAVAATSTGP